MSQISSPLDPKEDLIVIAGAGGFIGGALVRYFREKGFARIRAVDKKSVRDWYHVSPGVENLSMDLRNEEYCKRAAEGAREVYNLACDMGGMGFIELYRIECLRSILINTHLVEAASNAGAERYFFSSTACVYDTRLQEDPHCRALRETDAYPAYPERGYGWEKLISEIFCQEYTAERGLKTAIARFHNVYGPWGTWDGGREKVPAAICRKIITAKDKGLDEIEIWGDGEQTRSFMYIEDCLHGIDAIMHCEQLNAVPINLGSSEMISINQLVSIVEEIGGVKLKRKYKLDAPKGVAGRSSDNTMIQEVLGWQPSIKVRDGLKTTYAWIEQQYNDRKAGKRTVRDTI